MHPLDAVEVDAHAFIRYLPGDVLAVLAFVLLGTTQHGSFTLERYAGVLLPFFIGWMVVAPLFGGYDSRTVESTRSAIVAGVAAWLGADFLGQLLRATDHFPGDADPQFFLVAFAFGGALIAAVRFGTLVVVDLASR